MVLEYMGGDSRKGRKGYKQFMQEGICQGVDSPLIMGRGSGIIGETEFIEWVKATVLGDTGDKREQPALMKLRKSLQPEAVMAGFAEITGKQAEGLCQRGSHTVERALLMEVLYRGCDITQPEIGRLVGGVDYSAVSQARKRLQEKIANDKKLKQKCDKIVKQLMEMSR